MLFIAGKWVWALWALPATFGGAKRVIVRLTFGVLLVLAGGCVMSRAVPSVSPRSPDWEGPVVVRVQESGGSEGVLNLPVGSLTSEAALVSASDDEVCFDLKLRTWQGASPEWQVALSVDERAVATAEPFLRPCTKGSVGPADKVPLTLSCLPIDSPLAAVTTDSLDSVQVRGDRLCMKHHGALKPESESVTLSVKQGAAGYSFGWQFTTHD